MNLKITKEFYWSLGFKKWFDIPRWDSLAFNESFMQDLPAWACVLQQCTATTNIHQKFSVNIHFVFRWFFYRLLLLHLFNFKTTSQTFAVNTWYVLHQWVTSVAIIKELKNRQSARWTRYQVLQLKLIETVASGKHAEKISFCSEKSSA